IAHYSTRASYRVARWSGAAQPSGRGKYSSDQYLLAAERDVSYSKSWLQCAHLRYDALAGVDSRIIGAAHAEFSRYVGSASSRFNCLRICSTDRDERNGDHGVANALGIRACRHSRRGAYVFVFTFEGHAFG